MVEYHRYDQYGTAWGDGRADFYATAFGNYVPHMIYDGVVDAGSDDTAYRPWYESRATLPTDVTLEPVVFVDGRMCRVETTVCLEPGGTPRTLRLYTAQLLDDFPDEWDYSRNTFQQAAPAKDLALDQSGCGVVTSTLVLDALATSRPKDLVVVVWAQEPLASGPAEVAQAAQTSWPFAGVFGDGFETGDSGAWSAVAP